MAEAARVIEARPEAGSAAIDLRDVINELSQVSTRLKNVFIETHPQLSQIGDSANANRQVAASNANVVEPGPEPAAAAAAPSTIADPILGAKIVQGLGTAASVFKTIVTLLDLANQTSNLAELLTKCGVNTAGVLVAAADLAAIYYIEQGLNIQLEYDQKILDMLQSTADQYRIKKIYDALLKNVTELHTLLHNAVLNNWRGLPDSPGIQMLLEEMQVDVNRYYEIHDELNAEIEEAVAMLKSVKRWTIVKYHAKWASSGLVLGAGSYGLMCYKTGSWLDWRSWGLGGTVIAVTIAIGLYKLNSPKEQAKLATISSDINTLEKSAKKFKGEKKDLEDAIRKLEISSSKAYPNESLPSLRGPRAHVKEIGVLA